MRNEKDHVKREVGHYSEQTFESIKHINKYGQEIWYARELQKVLEYKRWDKFSNVIEKANIACKGSGNDVSDHFSHVGKMVINRVITVFTSNFSFFNNI